MAETLDAFVTRETRDALLAAGRPRQFHAGEVIFHQGDPCDSLFLLRRGSVAVRVLTPDGNEVCVGLVAAPDEFGELGLLRAEPCHTATVVALEDVLVVAVSSARFHELRIRHPGLTEWLLHSLARRLTRSSELLADALYLDAERRVVRRLNDCCSTFGVRTGGSLHLAQDDVAVLAGVSRSTANRALRRLEAEGIVRLGRRCIEVVDAEALARQAQ